MSHRAGTADAAPLFLISLLVAAGLGGARAQGQGSVASLRFSELSAGKVELRVALDDDVPGPDASAPCDVGAQGFTLELWLRGSAADHRAPGAGGGVELPATAWSSSHALVDRSLPGNGGAAFGIGLAGGRVRFYTGMGTAASEAGHVLEGSAIVLDGAWHHVACVRDAQTGVKRIYVDGWLDFASSPGASQADLSYPNGGLAGSVGPSGPLLLVGAAKDPQQPDFDGWVDELRAWSLARSAEQVLASYDRAFPVADLGLAAAWRFEEGSGAIAQDTSFAGSPSAQLFDSASGSSAWSLKAQDPANVPLISSTALPPGFASEVVVGGFVEPTAFALLPGGRGLVAERSGRIRMFTQGGLLPTPVIQLPAEVSSAERGLANLVLDPDFASNGWLYAYWTTGEPHNRVSRFTLVGASAALASEYLVWQSPTPALFFHHGGGLAFDGSGRLYIATGEHFLSGLSQDLGVQLGKLLRVNKDGSIPSDNPFATQGSPQDAMWAVGLRNPFRMSRDALTDTLWIGDVGGNNSGSSEELLRVGAPANYGWPMQEGETCWLGPGACGGITGPAYSYRHDADVETQQPAHSTAAIICGPLLRSSAFPAPYRDQLYCGDFARGDIRRVIFDSAGNALLGPIFAHGPEAFSIIGLAEGADGALWYLTHGTPGIGSTDFGELRRISYIGTAAAPPLAIASAQPLSGMPPLAVQFSSAGSLDPQPGPLPLSYQWSFGDGATSNEANPLHLYATPGVYLAQLTVSDGALAATSAPLSVKVGAPPVAQVLQPALLAPYVAGQIIDCSAQAQDLEDGVLPASAFTWRVLLKHDEHIHPYLGPISGTTTLSFEIPKSGHSPEHTHYIVQLTVTDSDGLTSVVDVPLAPVLSLIALDSSPSGVTVFIDGEGGPTPRLIESLQGFEHQLSALPTWSGSGSTLHFACWSDGGAAAHPFTAPVGGASLTVSYGAPGQSCAAADCGYASYGTALAAQTLGLIGIGVPTPGAPIEIRVLGLGGAANAWLGISAQPGAWPVFGGVLLVDPTLLVHSTALPASGGEASWLYTLPAGLSVGTSAYLQAVAVEPAVGGGIAFSAGLRLEACP